MARRLQLGVQLPEVERFVGWPEYAAEFRDAGVDEAVLALNPITEASIRFLGEVAAA